MNLVEKMNKVEESFNQYKEAYEEKQKQVVAIQQELVELEKQLLFVKGAYQMLVELSEEEKALHSEAENKVNEQICTAE